MEYTKLFTEAICERIWQS